MGLRDLDELVHSCRTDEARSFIAEAVACYRSGAFRACVVATWIAVVYDTLAKFRELALGGDKEAQLIIDELARLQPLIVSGDQGAIKRILEIERTVVTVANDKFGFFDGQQVSDLARLQEDRNRCAHPTYQGTDQPYHPSAELARAHLVHAVDHVLALPPVQGKAATAHIVHLVESNFFPEDVEQAKVQLRLGGLDRPKDSLVRAVADHFIFGFLEGGPPIKGRTRTAVAIKATYDMFPGIVEPRMRKAMNTVGRRIVDKDLYLFFALQAYLSHTWGMLEEDNKNRVRELVRHSNDDLAQRLLPNSLTIPDLESVSIDRIIKLDHQALGNLLKRTTHSAAIARAVDIYCSAKSWDRANTYYQSVISPVIDKLDEMQIRRILLAPRQEDADLMGSHGFDTFVRYVYEKEKMPRADVIATLRENGMEWMAARIAPAEEDEHEDPGAT
jgi:hypothetical protein